jgi:hypothetical protein
MVVASGRCCSLLPSAPLELYAYPCYLLLVVAFPPDVLVFAATRDISGRWAVLAPVNHHPGGGVGVRCVVVIARRECRFSLEPLPRSLGAKQRGVRGARGARDRRRR